MRYILYLALAIITGTLFASTAASAGSGHSISIRFPAFALSPGERISGVTMSTSAGRPVTGCRPNRWTCDHEGNTIHCYTIHPQYAIGISGMLPEFFVRNANDDTLSIQASVEFLDNDGREYTKDFRKDDLIIK
jgi:hypothetical protein